MLYVPKLCGSVVNKYKNFIISQILFCSLLNNHDLQFKFPILYLFLTIICFSQCSWNQQGDPIIGQQIYEQGILSDGSALQATGEGGTLLSGEIISCARCHRKSGFGSFEGTVYVPPITSDMLFKDQLKNREDMIRSLYHEEFTLRHWAKIRNLGQRPAYSEALIKNALMNGINSSNNTLDPIMPRYTLPETDFQHLLAYLKKLNQSKTPGIDQKTVHFATILTEDVTPKQEALFQEFVETFVSWKNKSVAAQLKRAAISPNYKDAFAHTYLEWKVHFWKLKGTPTSWTAQLKDFYQQQPVFAFLSGLSNQDWQPIHQFSERHQIPCIFPNTNFPYQAEEAYSLYFSKGAVGEAISLAKYLQTQSTPTIQVYADTPKALKLKKAFELAGNWSTTKGKLSSLSLSTFKNLKPSNNYLQDATSNQYNVVLWIDGVEIVQEIIPDFLKDKCQIYTSFQDGMINQLLSSQTPIYHTYPFTLPNDKIARNYRIKAWMRSRGLNLEDEPLQMNTYFALTVTDFAISHLVGNYSREYLIERIEHETENNLNPGIFPSLSLGPGQRFAAKGNYIVSMSKSDTLEVLGYY